MHHTTEALLQHFFAREVRQKRWYRASAWCCMGGMVVMSALTLLSRFDLLLSTVLNMIGMVLVVILFTRFNRLNHSLDERLSSFLTHIEVDWSEISSLNLSNEQQEAVYQAYTTSFSPVGKTNKDQRRLRGQDDKGPAFGDASERFAQEATRHDPQEHEADYADLEGPLRPAETLVEEANLVYAEHAQERWKQAEESDIDLIEAGVESLGDLVASGWFEKNAEDGAVSGLVESNDTV